MIGSSLKRLLSERGMTVRELSEKINVPVQTLYSIIRRDNMKIDFDVLLRICDALETPLDYFCRASSNAARRRRRNGCFCGVTARWTVTGRRWPRWLWSRSWRVCGKRSRS